MTEASFVSRGDEAASDEICHGLSMDTLGSSTEEEEEVTDVPTFNKRSSTRHLLSCVSFQGACADNFDSFFKTATDVEEWVAPLCIKSVRQFYGVNAQPANDGSEVA